MVILGEFFASLSRRSTSALIDIVKLLCYGYFENFGKFLERLVPVEVNKFVNDALFILL